MIEFKDGIYVGQEIYKYRVKTDNKTLRELVNEILTYCPDRSNRGTISVMDAEFRYIDGFYKSRFWYSYGELEENIPEEYLDARILGASFCDSYGSEDWEISIWVY